MGQLTEAEIDQAALRRLERRREADRRYYAANPEKFRERQKGYRTVDPEGKKAVKKAWYDANPGYQRDWYAENADEQRAKMRQRRAAKPDVYSVHSRNRRARRAAAEGIHTSADVTSIRSMQGDRCAYCRTKLNGKGHVDHIVSLARGGFNWPRNLQILCDSCNHRKNCADPVDFARSIGRLI